MQTSQEQLPEAGLSRRWIVVLSVCCLVAIPLSGYLAWIALTSSKVAGCGGGRLFNCGHVISSRWSLWMGIPVSLLASGLYVGMASALWIGSSERFKLLTRELAWLLVTTLAISAGLAACWFVGVQVFILRHLCTYCLIAHCCGLIAAGVVLWNRPISINALKCAFALGAVGIGILISGQVFSEPPPTFEIERFVVPAVPSNAEEFAAPSQSGEVESDDTLFDAPVINKVEPSGKTSGLNASHTSSALFALVRPQTLLAVLASLAMPQETGSVQSSAQPTVSQSDGSQSDGSQSDGSATPDKPAPAATRRTVAIIGGSVKLDVTQWPIVGSPQAKYIFVEMFDYACPHCRNTHRAIEGARKHLGAMLPSSCCRRR